MLTQVKSTEAMVNSRPLARDTDSPSDLPVCISPSDLIIGRRSSALPAAAKELDFSETVNEEQLTRRLRHQKLIFDRSWKCWTSHYLKDLNNFAQRDRSGCLSPIRIGPIVMIRDYKQPRLRWKVGLVIQLNPGRDGRIRSVILRSPAGHCSSYAVQALYPLETQISLRKTGATSTDHPDYSHLEIPADGNSRGECKKKEEGELINVGLPEKSEIPNPQLDATRTLRSGRPHCILPRL
jgi:hypothetical protein